MPEEFPSVLFIDDDDGALRVVEQQLRAFAQLRVATSTPNQLAASLLEGVDLVLVDLDLKLKDSPIGSAPDGVALASVLRRRVVQFGREQPVGFALLSAELKGLAAPLPDSDRKPLLAAQHNLEWIFEKGETDWINRVSSLARAIHEIPKEWADGIDDISEIAPQLKVEGAKDADRIWQIVEDFRPPIYEFTTWSHGVAFIRWLLQTALPYPTFLWDSHRVAARWRVTQSDFVKTYGESESLRSFLGPAEYHGLLHDFDGMRWWRHRIEQLVWDSTEGDSQNPSTLRKVIFDKAQRQLEPTEQDRPIVAIGADARPINDFVTAENAVRVQPDGWPSRADTAWMLRSLIEAKPSLRKLVIEDDRETLPLLIPDA
jgi:CheY-like chemotaxis protein